MKFVPRFLIALTWMGLQVQDAASSDTFATDWDIVAEVNSYDEIDRRAIITMVRGYVKVKLEDTLSDALATGGEDRLWALKSIAISQGWMMKLSECAGWHELAEYYHTEAMNLADYITGIADFDEYNQRSEQNRKLLADILGPYVNNQSFLERMEQQKPLADRIGAYFVGASKLAAGE